MTIKELAYSAQKHLQSRSGGSVKRAHVYEMLAAAFGFNSYAALTSDAVFTQRRLHAEAATLDSPAIWQRCIELGYLPDIEDVISSRLPVFVAERKIDVITLPDLAARLRSRSIFFTASSDWNEEDVQDETIGETWAGYHHGNVPPILLEGLEAAANNGSPVAHYALALIYVVEEDDHFREEGSEYWYNQEQHGRVLIGVQKEWADVYAKQLVEAEKHVYHLREAARLGYQYALLELAERFNDPAFFERNGGAVVENPIKVSELANRLGRTDDAHHWLTVAAEAGDIDAMRQLIEGYDNDDLGLCWKWLYLAQLVGTDLALSNYSLVNEDGTEYDEDVGGPGYPIGEEGVTLAALDAVQEAAARQSAHEAFKLIRRRRAE